jgi:hypothetical protein
MRSGCASHLPMVVPPVLSGSRAADSGHLLGRVGEIYMMLIQPFRHLIVYPVLMRQIGHAWDARDIARAAPHATPAQVMLDA